MNKVAGIHSYLVKPKSSGKPTLPLGTPVGLSGKLFDLLNRVFLNANTECSIDIAFKMNDDGTQYNEMRTMILEHVHASSTSEFEKTADKIALRLAEHTTFVTGSGLLFVIRGTMNGKPAVVLSRFPADEGIVADDQSSKLTIDFVDKLFLKDRRSYKAVVFKGLVPNTSRRTGRAVDKQINDVMNPTSKYWIHEFLLCDFTVTSAAGTKRFAEALKSVTNKTEDLALKASIAGAAMVLSNFNGQTMSAEQLMKQLKMPAGAIDGVRDKIGKSAMAESFKFDAMIFGGHYKYRTKVLDNGAILTADASTYDEIFDQKEVGDKTQFSTTGTVTKERIGKRQYGA